MDAQPAPKELPVASTAVTASQRHRVLATALYCFVLFLGGCCVNIVGQAGPSLARSMHVSLAVIGNVFSAEGIGNTLGSSLVGGLLERHSGHTLVSLLCVGLFFAVSAIPSCTMLWQVVGLYMVIGACLGMLSVASNTLITWVNVGRNVGPWVNLINACFGLGASSAPMLFVFVERRVGNGLAAFSAIGALAAVPALAAALVRTPDRPAPAQPAQSPGRADPETDGAGASSSGGGLGASRGTSSLAGVDLGSRAAYVRATVTAPLMVMLTLVIGAEIAFAGWVYVYAMARVGMRSVEAAYLNSLFWTTFTIGRLCTVPAAAFVSPGALLLPTMAVEVLSLLAILLRSGSAQVLWAGTVGAGLGVCAIYSNVISLLASYDLLTPSTVSSMSMAAALGHMTLPNAVGFAIHTFGLGFDALIWIVLVANAIGFALIALVVVHLRRNFIPVPDSVSGRQLLLARKRAAVHVAEEGQKV